CRHASLALGGVGPHPLVMRRAEALLAGGPLTDRRLAEAADAVPGEGAPESDVHATAAYRRAMARGMAYRALAPARGRAGPAPGPVGLLLAGQAAGRAVTTVKGLGAEGRLHPLQGAFVAHEAAQCGFCTPGMLLVAHAFLADHPRPTRDEIRSAIAGNLCRCT